jgi:Zn-dependent M28 family amino/carboxypeptidase
MPDRTIIGRVMSVARLVFGAASLIVACGPSSPPAIAPGSDVAPSAKAVPDLVLPQGADRAAEQITPERLRAHVETFSSDAFEGRGPGSSGDAAARAWLAEQLGALGFVPGGADGSWEQPFPIVGITTKVPETWSFAGPKKRAEPLTLRWWDDFIAASGVQQTTVDVRDAEVVFVGYGITAPEEDWNDFEGADLRGKMLLVLNDDPDWDPELFGGARRLYYGRWTYKYEEAGRQGAVGAIIVHTTESAGYPWGVVQTSWSGEQFELPAGDEPRAAVHGWVTQDAARRLVALGGHEFDALVEQARSREFRPVPLGVRTNLRLETTMDQTQTANVLGLLPGSDEARAKEVVVVTAHHDHLGIGKPDESGDRIYNGARDNATGVAQALGVAEAFAALPEPPPRSVLIAFVGAEEQGLLGSKHYASNPTFAPEAIAANINFELGNIWGRTHDVVIHGKGKTDLDALVVAAAEHQERRVEDEADPRSGWYYRSDQFSFAQIGVPSIWFESGRDYVGRPEGWGDEVVERWIAEHYHQPSDELQDDWNFEGMVDDTRLGFWVAAAVATAPRMPQWAPGDEFADRREP